MDNDAGKDFKKQKEANLRASTMYEGVLGVDIPPERVTPEMSGAVASAEKKVAFPAPEAGLQRIVQEQEPTFLSSAEGEGPLGAAPDVQLGEDFLSAGIEIPTQPKQQYATFSALNGGPDTKKGETLPAERLAAYDKQREEWDRMELTTSDTINMLANEFWESGVKGGIAGGVGSLTRMGGGAIRQIEEAAGTEAGQGMGEWLEQLGKVSEAHWKKTGQDHKALYPHLWEGEFLDNPSALRAAMSVASGAPSMGAAVIIGTLTKSPTAAAAFLSSLEGSGAYGEFVDAGKDPQKGLALAAVTIAGLTVLEKLGLDAVLKGRGNVLQLIAGGAAGEALTEGAQTVFQNAMAKFTVDEQRALFTGLVDAMIAGGVLGGGMSAVAGQGPVAEGLQAEGETAQEVVADALKKGIIKPQTATIANRLLSLDPDVDKTLVVEIANVLEVATPEILEAQGITPEEGQVFAVTGRQSPQVTDGILQSTISLYKGANPTTFVEEWYHRYLDALQVSDPESYDQLATIYEEAQAAGDTRVMQEWFGHQGRDWFMQERPDSPISSILAKGKAGLKALFGRLAELKAPLPKDFVAGWKGAGLDPTLLEHFQRAGGAKPTPTPTAPVEGVAQEQAAQVEASEQVAGMDTGVGGWLADVAGLDTPGEITDAVTAMYTDPESTIMVGSEPVRAGDLKQRYTIDVVSESYQVKPMRLKQQNGEVVITDAFERLRDSYTEWIGPTLEQLDEQTKFPANTEGGVMNLERMAGMSEEAKALMVAAGYREEAIAIFLAAAYKTKTHEDMIDEAAANPMSPQDILEMPTEGLAVNPTVMLWTEFWTIQSFEATSQLFEQYNTATDPDIKSSLAEEVAKLANVTLGMQMKMQAVNRVAGQTLNVTQAKSDSLYVEGQKLGLQNFHNIFAQTAETGRQITDDTFINMLGSLQSPEQYTNMVIGAQYPTWPEMLHEYWLFSILSGPKTQAVNIASNTVFLATNVVERQIAGLNPEQNVKVGEAAQMTWAGVTGLWDAFKAAGLALKTGRQEGTKAEDVNREPKITADHVGGKMGIRDFEATTIGKGFDLFADWILRGPFRGLATGDAFFRSLAHRMEYRAQALRQAHQNHAADLEQEVENPKTVQEYFDAFMGEGDADPATLLARQALMEKSRDFADIVTFQKKLGNIGEGFSSLANQNLIGRFVMPFVRTPSNIIRETIKRSPLELGALANKESSLRRAIAEGGAERDLAFAQIGLGGLAMGMMSLATINGFVTGTPPEDFKRRRALERLGYQWHSINVTAMERGDAVPQAGDIWVSFDRLDPIGSLVGMAVDATYIMGTTEPTVDEAFVQLPTALVQALAVNVTSKTYLRGLSDFIQFMTDPTGWKGKKFVQRQVVSFIPNILNQPGQAVDPYRREAETTLEMAKMRSGFFGRQDLPAMMDRWGRKMEDNPAGFYGMFFPGYIKEARPNPVDEEIVRLMEVLPEDKTISGLNVSGFDKIGNYELTPEQRADYLGMGGGYAYEMLDAIVTRSPEKYAAAAERIGKELVEGTFYDKRKIRVSKKQAQMAVDAYYSEEAWGSEGYLPNITKAAIISDVLSSTKDAAMFNMAKKNKDIWDSMLKEGYTTLDFLENAPGIENFGIKRPRVDQLKEQLEGSYREVVR